MHSFIHKLEDLEEYEFPFERLKHILKDQYYSEEEKKKMAAEKKKQEAAQEATVEEVTDEEAKQIERENNQIVESKSKIKDGKDLEDELMNGGSTIDLAKIKEGDSTAAKD